MFMRTIILVLCVWLINSIGMTVNSIRNRCMTVSTANEQNELKVNLKLPAIQNPSGSYYLITLVNTQTNHQQQFQLSSGVFRRQFRLDQNVAYRLCLKIIAYPAQIQILKIIQYETDTHHQIEGDMAKIKVPQSLLKVQDLSETYSYLVKTKNILDYLSEKAEELKQEEDANFNEQTSLVSTLQTIAILQFVVICLFGAYQYMRLRQVIQSRRDL